MPLKSRLWEGRDFGSVILDTVAALVIVLDSHGRIVLFNRACERLTGYRFAVVRGRYFWDFLLVPEEIDEVRAVFKHLLAGQFPNEHENRWVARDGSQRWIAWSNTALLEEGGRVEYVIGTGIDITARRQAESLLADHVQALQESEQRYRSLFKNNHAVMLLIDPETAQIVDANPAACAFYDYSLDEIIRLKITDINTLTAGEVFQEMENARSESRNHFLFRHRLAGGEVRDVEVYSGPIQIEGKSLLYSIIHDITERRQAQEALKAYTRQLERTNRELQDFAFFSSHDLQEPLRKIQVFADRLKARYGAQIDETGQDYLARMQSAAARMQRMIRDLLAYSRVTTQARPFEAVDLRALTQEVISDLEVRLEQYGGQIIVGDGLTVEADPLQMRQLIQNLISNALKFHRDGSPPVVKVSFQTVFGIDGKSGEQQKNVQDSLQLAENLQPDSSQFIEVVVEDNGIGFDEQYLERIFQPFQRLHGHSEYEGTGIGLAICRKIAERHGGTITAHGAPGQGATFIIRLPKKQPL